MVAIIEALKPALPGARLRIEGGIDRPPMERTATTMEPFHRAQKIAASLGMTLVAGESGGASDANITTSVGVPTLDGLGAMGDGCHAADEHVIIDSLAQRAALLAALLSRW